MTRSNSTSDELIQRINSDNVDAITEGIQAELPIIRLNALLHGTRLKICNDVFIDNIRQIADSSSESFFGVPFKKYAIAALDVLGKSKYTGNDDFINRLIKSDFQTI